MADAVGTAFASIHSSSAEQYIGMEEEELRGKLEEMERKI